MLGYIIIVVVTVLAAAAAVALIARAQAKSLRRKLRLELVNRGNVPSRYELSVGDPDDALSFEFTLDDDPLPQRQFPTTGQTAAAKPVAPAPTGQPAGAAGVQPKLNKAVGFTGTIANSLNSLGMILPRSMRTPVVRLASQIQSGQMKAVRARQVSDQATRVKSMASSRTAPKGQGAPGGQTGPGSVETPFAEPGETQVVDLLVRAIKPGTARQYAFSVRSRSIELEEAPWVVEEARVQISSAGGLARYLPYLFVLFVTAAILMLLVWLAVAGSLG